MSRPIRSNVEPTKSGSTHHATARRGIPVSQNNFLRTHSSLPRPPTPDVGEKLHRALLNLVAKKDRNAAAANTLFSEVKRFPPKGKPFPLKGNSLPPLSKQPSTNSLPINNRDFVLPLYFKLSGRPSDNNTVIEPNANNIHTLFQPIESPTPSTFRRQNSLTTASNASHQVLFPLHFKSPPPSPLPINALGNRLNQNPLDDDLTQPPLGGKRKTTKRSKRSKRMKKTHKRK